MTWRSLWPSVVAPCLSLCWFFLPGVGACISQAQSLRSFVPLDATAREAIARQILVQADSSGPADQSLSFALYRRAGAWAAIDQSRAIQLYRQAFSYARGSTANVRAPLETAILLKIMNQISEEDRVPFLVQAADLYLRAGDKEASANVIQDGFKLARAAYEKEAASKTSSGAVPPCYWEAAEIYRQMVTVGAYASLERTREAVDEIPDAGLRNVEKVMVARALLGVPVRRRITINASGVIQADQGMAYDNF